MEDIEYWENVLFNSQDLLIDHLFSLNILKQQQLCCGTSMSVIIVAAKGDGHMFKCNICKNKKSIRTGSFFYNLKLPLGVICTVLIFWSEKSLQKDICEKIGVSKNTIQSIYKKSRDKCLESMEKIQRLGGDGYVIKIY